MQLRSVVGVCPFQDLFVHLPTLECDTLMNVQLIHVGQVVLAVPHECDTLMNVQLIHVFDLSDVQLNLLVEIFRCVLTACQLSI